MWLVEALPLLAQNCLESAWRRSRPWLLVLCGNKLCSVQSAHVVRSEPRHSGSLNMARVYVASNTLDSLYMFDLESIFGHCMFKNLLPIVYNPHSAM